MNCTKCVWRPGFRGPAGLGSYIAPPDSLAVIIWERRKGKERVGNREGKEGEGREGREYVGIRKIIKIVAIRCRILKLKCIKFDCDRLAVIMGIVCIGLACVKIYRDISATNFNPVPTSTPRNGRSPIWTYN